MLGLAFCAALLHVYALALYLPLLLLLSIGGLARAATRYQLTFCAAARREGLHLLSLALRSTLALASE